MISRTIRYFKEYYITPGLYKKRYDYPTHINFPVTDNCNSQCQMCNVWKDKSYDELTPDQIETIFSDTLFKNVLHVGLSGGEPTLRKDLVEIVSRIIKTKTTLKSLSITSHGFHPKKWEKIAPLIKEQTAELGIEFRINISVDGIGSLHEEVRRVKGGWQKVKQTIAVVQRQNIPLQLQCTVSKHNIFGVNEVLAFAKENNLDVVFRKATEIKRLYNKKILDEFITVSQENSFLSDFVISKELMKTTTNPSRRLFYRDLAKRLVKKTERKAPCHFQNNGVLLSAHGELFHCSIDENPLGNALEESAGKIYFATESQKSKDELLSKTCPNCVHDQSGSWPPIKLVLEVLSAKTQIFQKLVKPLRFLIKNITVAFFTPKPTLLNENKEKCAHIIGAYGGEHVGDSAILGGVLLRIKERHPYITKAIVYSLRPDRTSFWHSGLEGIDIEVEIKLYNQYNFNVFSKKDLLIWAGGPIMEMPNDLLNHYYTMKIFSRVNIPFEIIGCGWGPFKTKYAKYLANMIVKGARHVQLRQKADIKSDYELLQDPAFDYLEHYSNIGKDLEWTFSKSKIDEFVANYMNNGKKNVFINIRPIWNKYNKSNYSNSHIEEIIIEKLVALIEANDFNFVAVPFNTDHYGFSDVTISLKLKKALGENQQRLVVFNRELNAKEMVYFLRKFNSGVSMRFHACIFAMALDLPVYGLDYTAGEKGKVGHLFDSFENDNYDNILFINEEKINNFLKHS
jgi:molybdenum cofactor biosynthesis enzyme MoaA/polysaccharide pyruvyl transferase WcaK-like protein